MISNLNDYPNCEPIYRTCDVCIVGAGTAGLFLAQSIQEAGIRVIVIELGGRSILDAEASFKKPKFSHQIYHGALKGRVSGLGGTSSKWGGQMIGLSESDFNLHEGVSDNVTWPITKKDLKPYYKKVASLLGFDNSRFSFKKTNTFKLFKKSLVSELFNIRVSTWIPFSKRNFAKTFRKVIEKSSMVEIWINTKLSSFENAVWEGERLTQLTFTGPDGQTLVINGSHFVLTMGAIETTKYVNDILSVKEIETSNSYPLCDHVSSSVGRLELKNRNAFLKAFSPFFVSNIMKTIRFEFLYESQVDGQTPSAFVHFATAQKKGSALEIIRSFAQKLQGRPFQISFRDIHLGKFLKDVTSILFWRFFRSRLILNHDGKVEVVVDIEQRPDPTNRILIKDNQIDLFWGVTENDCQSIATVAQSFRDSWNASPELSEIGAIIIEDDQKLINYYDVYHPTGSLPFGIHPDSSLLDPNLRLWCTNNVFVSSTAVFPTGGSANPGFTHLALTQRLSEHLKSKF